jgi:hypothetical protein
MRPHLAEIAVLLAPMMSKVGTPSPEKVRAALEQGLVRKDEFAGAFKRVTRRIVAVGRARPEDRIEEGPRDAAKGSVA